ERRVARGDSRVDERAGRVDGLEAAVEDVHATVVEVRRIEPVTRDGQTLVDSARSGRGEEGAGRGDGRAEAENRSVLGREEERCGRRGRSVRDHEARPRVRHGTGRRT